ncbi:MAG TPA: AraC family transcriptional regulator ligand-binding domain-containing protein [Parvibaculum sp.]|uniref:AraC family transcriptional regulator n=1 Tax=Parvibaculum sp. TaxID=2024848 RepID=UPI002CE602F4|nr:AraC family transcriptional regulator ligand-binding domain-containing protein [Parvibaculum sp.]HMM15891.1 AraC family transcriptional regulator ligand-binding domain-containing protein [Parvibaculum sp.]
MQIEPGYVSTLANVMRAYGYNHSVIGRIPEKPIDEGEFLQVCTRAVAESQDAALGLRFGAALQLGGHGVLGHALMSCRTLRQAAELLVRHNPLRSPEGRVRLAYEGESTILGFAPAFEVPGAPQFLCDMFFAAATTGIRQLLGRELARAELELAYSPDVPNETYDKYLRVPVSFGKPTNRLIGPKNIMDMPLQAAGVATAPAYLRQCELLLRQMEAASGFESGVRRLLLSSRGRFPAAPEIAHALNLSERTLRRRLSAEGTSYQKIINDVRNHLAKQYLIDTKLSVADIGTLIGFEDLSNFRHAFRRWNGVTPSHFRTLNAKD